MIHFDLNGNLASILTLISALTAAVVSIINALAAKYRAKANHERLNKQDEVLTQIKTQTDGALTALREEAKAAQDRADNLQEALKQIVSARQKRKTDLGIKEGEIVSDKQIELTVFEEKNDNSQ